MVNIRITSARHQTALTARLGYAVHHSCGRYCVHERTFFVTLKNCMRNWGMKYFLLKKLENLILRTFYAYYVEQIEIVHLFCCRKRTPSISSTVWINSTTWKIKRKKQSKNSNEQFRCRINEWCSLSENIFFLWWGFRDIVGSSLERFWLYRISITWKYLEFSLVEYAAYSNRPNWSWDIFMCSARSARNLTLRYLGNPTCGICTWNLWKWSQ